MVAGKPPEYYSKMFGLDEPYACWNVIDQRCKAIVRQMYPRSDISKIGLYFNDLLGIWWAKRFGGSRYQLLVFRCYDYHVAIPFTEEQLYTWSIDEFIDKEVYWRLCMFAVDMPIGA